MGLIGLLLFLLLLSPILCSVVCFVLLKKYYNNTFYSYICFLFLGFSVGLLNSLKVHESDLINYAKMFKNSISFGYFEYLQIENKEYLYGTINYLFSNFVSSDFNSFLVFFGGLSYGFIFYAIRILDANLKLGKESYLFAIAIAVLFPNIFSVSAHLMRQFLASSIILVFLMKTIFNYKKSFLFLLSAIFIHSSSMFFAIVYLPFLKNKLSVKKLILFSGFSITSMFMMSNYSSFLQSIPVVGYAFHRFFRRENAVWETDSLGFLSLLIQFIVLGIYYMATKIKSITNKDEIYRLFYISLLLCVLILVNYNNTEIASRFNFYFYFLFIIGVYFLNSILKIKGKEAILVNSSIVGLFMFWFVYKLLNGTWTYTNLEKIILTII